jgi:16S rRNA (cytosine1402-N4)-methyltransferase
MVSADIVPYHIPVMVDAVTNGLNIIPTGIYADATFGGGGHAKQIAGKLTTGHLFAFDKDPAAAAIANACNATCVTFTRAPFRFVQEFIHFYGIEHVDGLLADLGTSSHQIDCPERGFSTRFNGTLDMRMDPQSTLTAKQIVNSYSHTQLTKLLYAYGEVPEAPFIAQAIVKARSCAPITTTHALKTIVQPFAKKAKENQYFAKVFQALRIEVNRELEELETLLECSAALIKPGGRMAILSYHSLEDRLVKNFLNTGNVTGTVVQDAYGNPLRPFVPIQKKPFVASMEEIRANPRARSVRLRIGIRVQ